MLMTLATTGISDDPIIPDVITKNLIGELKLE
jgi:hypothetical protein